MGAWRYTHISTHTLLLHLTAHYGSWPCLPLPYWLAAAQEEGIPRNVMGTAASGDSLTPCWVSGTVIGGNAALLWAGPASG